MLSLLYVPGLIVLFLLCCLCVYKRLYKTSYCLLIVIITINIYSQSFAVNFFRKQSPNVKTISLISYNVNGWGNWKKGWSDKDSLLAWISSQQADVLAIQEYMFWEAGDFGEKLMKLYPYTNAKLVSSTYVEPMAFSKYPILSCRRISEYSNIMDILVEHDTLHICNCYLPSNNYTRSKGINECVKSLKTGYDNRAVQVDMLYEHIQPHKTIVLGDLNDVSGSYVMSKIRRKGFEDTWWNGGNGFGFTFSNFPLYVRLDHILYSKDLFLKSVSVPHLTFSDHFPVVAEIGLRNSN